MSPNSKLIAALAVVLLIAAGAAMFLLRAGPEQGLPETAGGTATRAPTDQFITTNPAPDFAAVAPLAPVGKPADMAAYRGRALLVNLWATWCAPCIRELPSLGKLQATLGGVDFAVVTIALDEPDATKVAPFLAQHGAANLPALIDANRTIDTVMPVPALPTSFLVDTEGKVRAVFTGDAEWHCGAALAAVQAFIADGSVSQERLSPCS